MFACKAILVWIGSALVISVCNAESDADSAIKDQLAVKQAEVDLLKSQIEALKNATQFNPVEGNADIGDSVSIEVEVLAQKRLRVVAKKIVERIQKSMDGLTAIVIADSPADLQPIVEYKVVQKTLAALNKDYDELKPALEDVRKIGTKSFATATAIFSFASLFRTDVSLKGAKQA